MKACSFFFSIALLGAITVSGAKSKGNEVKPPEAAPQVQTSPVTDGTALIATKTHLQNALKAMSQAYPIYGGPREKAMTAARHALEAINHELNPTPPPPRAKRPARKVAPAQQVSPTKTQEEKIFDSQAAMTTGKQELEAAAKELANATTWSKSDAGAGAVAMIGTAITQVKASIAVFAKDK